MKNIVIKDFSDIQGFNRLSRKGKLNLVESLVSPSYEVIGFVNQSNNIKLKCRFHNVRDNLGRWTCKRKR
jgi:hypothetical protein